eukprot:8265136-Pyramimonas_sp.AAC.1
MGHCLRVDVVGVVPNEVFNAEMETHSDKAIIVRPDSVLNITISCMVDKARLRLATPWAGDIALSVWGRRAHRSVMHGTPVEHCARRISASILAWAMLPTSSPGIPSQRQGP